MPQQYQNRYPNRHHDYQTNSDGPFLHTRRQSNKFLVFLLVLLALFGLGSFLWNKYDPPIYWIEGELAYCVEDTGKELKCYFANHHQNYIKNKDNTWTAVGEKVDYDSAESTLKDDA